MGTEDGSTLVTVGLTGQANNSAQARRALAGMADQIAQILRELEAKRQDFTEEEKRQIEQEEREAALKDCPAPEGEDACRCVVCLDSRRACALMPCRHLATCHKCTVMIAR